MASAKEPFSCDNHFGENLQIITEQVSVRYEKTVADLATGDFNGDSFKDKLLILRLDKTTKFNDDVVVHPTLIWLDNRKPNSHFTSIKGIYSFVANPIALAIIQSDTSDKKCRKFIVYTTVSASEAKHLLVDIFHVKNEWYKSFQNLASSRMNYDAIYLRFYLNIPTASPPAALIYWNNDKYIFDLPVPNPEDEEGDADE
jgi:hypothetical protein